LAATRDQAEYFVRSYVTHHQTDLPVIDYDYGNFIVRDFNFDGKEDFAVKLSDNNAGPLYEYYVQQNGIFKKDYFLTDSVGSMIDSFDINSKQAFMIHNAGCCRINYYTFHFDTQQQQWSLREKKTNELNPE
jgi:hypothetical protein